MGFRQRLDVRIIFRSMMKCAGSKRLTRNSPPAQIGASGPRQTGDALPARLDATPAFHFTACWFWAEPATSAGFLGIDAEKPATCGPLEGIDARTLQNAAAAETDRLGVLLARFQLTTGVASVRPTLFGEQAEPARNMFEAPAVLKKGTRRSLRAHERHPGCGVKLDTS